MMTYEQLVTTLAGGLNQATLYSVTHPRVVERAEEFARALNELLEVSGKPSFFLGVARGRLVHEGKFLIGPSLLGRKVAEFAVRLHCGGFLFRRGLRAEELVLLLAMYADRKASIATLVEAREALKSAGIRNVDLSPPFEEPAWFGQLLFTRKDERGAGEFDEHATSLPLCQSLFEAVETAHNRASSDHALDLDGARGVGEALLRGSEGGFRDILQLVRYPDYDSYTVGHSVRVALFSVMIGKTMGVPAELLVELGAAGLLHDVGKSKIPESILYKKGKLDDEERRIMCRHPELGARILLENKDASPLGIAAAWGHHRRHDQGGYPAAARWACRSDVTAVVQVCDVFEALTAVRPYKPAMSPARAYEIMLRDKGAFDPAALSALLRTMGLYPPGVRVQLSNGDQAAVIAAGERIDGPLVQVTHDRLGLRLPETAVREVDLSAACAQGLSVAAVIPDNALANVA